jgi:tyrosyl-tRNA synthetase
MSCAFCILQADICQLGMDQRKVNMLAREYCDDIKRKLKPIILGHRMMPGLLEVSPFVANSCLLLAVSS